MGKITNFMIVIFVALFPANIEAQDIIQPGLIKAQLTLSPSYNFGDKQSYFYLHGNLEYYLNKKVSLTGDGYYFLGNLSDQSSFDVNHTIFFGASYHIIKDHHDFCVGLQPGIAITKAKAPENIFIKTKTGINPIVSPLLGYNIFIHKHFHFFIQSRLVLGQHNHNFQHSLNEIRFSAGLGFNI